MIKVQLVCVQCGKESDAFNIYSHSTAPHFGDLQSEVSEMAESIGWIFQKGVCGDIYCSMECSR